MSPRNSPLKPYGVTRSEKPIGSHWSTRRGAGWGGWEVVGLQGGCGTWRGWYEGCGKVWDVVGLVGRGGTWRGWSGDVTGRRVMPMEPTVTNRGGTLLLEGVSRAGGHNSPSSCCCTIPAC